MDDSSSRKSLPLWVAVAEVLGLIVVVMNSYWFAAYYSGYNWGAQVFNMHPLFMVIGFVFLNGNGLMIYRILPGLSKPVAKALHAIINLMTLVSVIIALAAVFKALGAAPTQVYTLHSWVGLTAVIFYAAQWVLGFIVFLAPGLDSDKKAWYLPIHQWLGVGTFALAIGATLLGISEKTFSKVDAFSTENYLFNIMSLLMIFFGLVVGHIVTYGPFARPTHSTGEHIPLK